LLRVCVCVRARACACMISLTPTNYPRSGIFVIILAPDERDVGGGEGVEVGALKGLGRDWVASEVRP